MEVGSVESNVWNVEGRFQCHVVRIVTDGLFSQKSGQMEFAARLWPRSHGPGSPLSNPGTPQVALSAGIAQWACSCDAPGKQASRKFAPRAALEAGSWSKWIGQSGARRRWPARSGESIHVTARLWGGMPPPLALIWQCSTQHEHLRAGMPDPAAVAGRSAHLEPHASESFAVELARVPERMRRYAEAWGALRTYPASHACTKASRGQLQGPTLALDCIAR